MTAYQTFLPGCDCKAGGILFRDNIPHCRWCVRPWGHGGMINYTDKSFKASHTQQEPERIEQDAFVWNRAMVMEFALNPDKYGVNILDAVKRFEQSKSTTPKPQVLFTTEDGKGIFEGDEYWYVNYAKVNDIYKKVGGPFKCAYANAITDYEECLNFSTKEAADEYVLLNQPCLSVNDIAALWCLSVETRIELSQLAKYKQSKTK